MKKTCKKCGEEFELLPTHKGFANVCPKCSVQSPEDRAGQLADAASRHKGVGYKKYPARNLQ